MRKNQAAGIKGPDDEIFDDITERVSQMRRPGEDEMAFYERRYKERVRVLILHLPQRLVVFFSIVYPWWSLTRIHLIYSLILHFVVFVHALLISKLYTRLSERRL